MKAIPLLVLCALAGAFGTVDTFIGLIGGVAATAILFIPRRDEP